MRSLKKKPGKVIGLKIENHKPEESPQALAIALAGAIQEELNARSDLMEYKAQAQRERQKAKELNNLLIMLNEYRRKKKKALVNGEEWKPSRMEPMEFYNEDDIKKQKVRLIERAKEFDQMCIEFEKTATEANRKQADLQMRLKKMQVN